MRPIVLAVIVQSGRRLLQKTGLSLKLARKPSLGRNRSMNDTIIETIQVVTTASTREDVETIAREVVRKRLAACAQVSGPVTSYYWWKDELEKAQEWVCRIKTQRDLYDQLQDAIRAMHPYQVPEILALPVVDGNPDYLQWLAEETARDA